MKHSLRAAWSLIGIVLLVAAVAKAEESSVEQTTSGVESPASAVEMPPPEYSGRIYSDFYFPVGGDRSTFFRQASLSTWFQVVNRPSRALSSKLLLQMDLFDGRNSQVTGQSCCTHLSLAFRELVLAYHQESSNFSFKLGQLILPWGKSDGYNPTDYLTAKDQSYFNPDDEVRRTGALAGQMIFTPEEGASPYSLTAVWVMLPARGQILIPPGVLGSNVTVVSRYPKISMENAEAAVKLAYSGQGWDTAVSFFNGRRKSPELVETSRVFDPFAVPPLLLTVDQVYGRQRNIGWDGSFNPSKWIYRWETAYTFTENDAGTHALTEPSHWDTVLGVERPLGNYFRLQVQGISKIYPHFTSPEQTLGADALSTQINQQIAQANALISNSQESTVYTTTARLSYTDESTGWDSEIFWAYNIKGADSLLKPKVGYSFADGFKTSLGSDIALGSRSRPFGAMQSYNSIWFEAKYVF